MVASRVHATPAKSSPPIPTVVDQTGDRFWQLSIIQVGENGVDGGADGQHMAGYTSSSPTLKLCRVLLAPAARTGHGVRWIEDMGGGHGVRWNEDRGGLNGASVPSVM